jgi:uncharacterized ion transporter superfamily protein YfcC
MAALILFWAADSIAGLNSIVFHQRDVLDRGGLSFFVPSTSGPAILSMPILAPVADFAGVDRSLIVIVFQSAAGTVNLVTPKSALVMGGRLRLCLAKRRICGIDRLQNARAILEGVAGARGFPD